MTNPRPNPDIFAVQVGSARVKIYQSVRRGKTLYTVAFWRNGKRERRNFNELAEAKLEAQRAAASIQAGRSDVMQMSLAQAEQHQAAIRLLEPLGLPLIAALEDYLAAKQIVPTMPLVAVARDYHARYDGVQTGVRVATVVAELIAAKTQDGARMRYVQQLRCQLNRFAAAFPRPISEIKAQEMDAWIRKRNPAPRSRNSVVTLLRILFSFAKSQRYLMRTEETEADALTKARLKYTETAIFQPKEFALLLSKATPKMVPYLVLGGFCGLRTAESSRLCWEAVFCDRKVIELRAGQAKTGARRVVPMCDAVVEWLRPIAGEGPVFADKETYRDVAQLARENGIDWQRNVLRHSAISYRLAVVKNVGQVALEAGNSAEMIFKHYLELTSEHAANEWFGLTPSKVGNPNYASEAESV